jgi:predicted GIY-YIG superfamily endonuclease
MISKDEILKKSRRIIRNNYYIYALISNNEIVYIGQTSTLAMRLGSHISSYKKFDSWSIIEDLGSFAYQSDIDTKELQYIYAFKPKYNSQSKSLNFNKNKEKFLINLCIK